MVQSSYYKTGILSKTSLNWSGWLYTVLEGAVSWYFFFVFAFYTSIFRSYPYRSDQYWVQITPKCWWNSRKNYLRNGSASSQKQSYTFCSKIHICIFLVRIDISNVEFNQIAIFKHYKIFGDLFVPGVYFYMTQEMNVFYGDSEVITGNLLCASKSVEKPSVKLESLNNPEAYNSLFMVNMDGDFFEPEVESSQPSSSG